MHSAIQEFIEAHHYCRVLEKVIVHVAGEFERAALRDELKSAYEHLDRSTQLIVGIRFADTRPQQPN
jgi:hypothetical protein